MRCASAKSVLTALLAATVSAWVLADEPPVASERAVFNSYWGKSVVDPYQWMENEEDPEFKSWMKGQGEFTRQMLDAIPGKQALQQRIAGLSRASAIVSGVQRAGPYYFYLKQLPEDETKKLYVRKGLNGRERLLVDPGTTAARDEHFSIDYFMPSPDGSMLAYGTSPGGSEDTTIGVLDVVTGKVERDRITRARFGISCWASDGKSFFYNRFPNPTSSALPGDKYKKSKIYRHVVGANVDGEGDQAELGFGLSPAIAVAPDDLPSIVYSAASPYVLAIVQKFVKFEFALYAAPMASLDGAKTPWHKVADESDEITDVVAHGDALYLLTHKDASRFKVIRTSILKPNLIGAAVVVPTGEAVLRGLGLAKDAVYVQALDGGIGRLLRIPLGDQVAKSVTLPFAGAIQEMSVNSGRLGALLKLTSWTEPQIWYQYEPRPGVIVDTHLRPKSPVDYSNIASMDAKVRSADGTLVPLSIIYRRDLKLDGSNPTILTGYGSYGLSWDPRFDPTLLAWLERGGVFAVAHVRGGGEYGEDWHIGGQKLKKQNTISDFIACAEYLIREKYTSTRKLGGEGESAGGIMIGGALAQRPDLFAAIIDIVGVSDTLRFELSPNGPPNVPELGTVTTEDGFAGLYAMSPYHHVQNGTPYPAVLLTTGMNDSRVPPWQVAKMTAQLQKATTSGKPILLRVDPDAGHGVGSTNTQVVAETADEWSFLLWQFGDKDFQPY